MVGWAFLFMGEMIPEGSSGRVWKDQSWSGSNSRSERLQSLSPYPRRLFNPRKNGKKQIYFRENVSRPIPRLVLPFSFFFLFFSLSLLSTDALPRKKKKREKERTRVRRRIETRRRNKITRERWTFLPAATTCSGRAIAFRQHSGRRRGRRPPLASLNYARTFISGASVPDISKFCLGQKVHRKTISLHPDTDREMESVRSLITPAQKTRRKIGRSDVASCSGEKWAGNTYGGVYDVLEKFVQCYLRTAKSTNEQL